MGKLYSSPGAAFGRTVKLPFESSLVQSSIVLIVVVE